MNAGDRYGALSVIEFSRVLDGEAYYRCLCDCGREVEVNGCHLRAGLRKACARDGHYWRERKGEGFSATNPVEYAAWRRMHDLCQRDSHKKFPRYDGRGIRVHARWALFENFLTDLGPRPSPEFSIGRLDINKHFEPGNVRWMTKQERRQNITNSIFVNYKGRRMQLVDLVSELGLDRKIVYNRLRLGWPLEHALVVPTAKRQKRPLPNPPLP